MIKNAHFSSIVWIKNDLRIRDNPALSFASHQRGPTLCLYVLDRHFYHSCYGGKKSLEWLFSSLNQFAESLQDYGIPLLFCEGDLPHVIRQTIQQFKVSSVVWNEGLEPASLKKEIEIQRMLEKEKITTHIFPGNRLIDPKEFFTKQGSPFQLFTPFWKAAIPHLENIQEAPLPKKQTPLLPSQVPKPIIDCQAGEKMAWKQWNSFSEQALDHYATAREYMAQEGTSRISPHLHFGELSARSLIKEMNGTPNEYTRQLFWREFAHYLLHHYPQIATHPFRQNWTHFPWRKSPAELSAWKEGKTGVPIVDAAMRQLLQTGWMHNRARMIVASFLTKHLLHSWTEGQDWFWETLFDADEANNTFGWQYIAGTGADSAPFFRIFNPLLQAKKFDKDGAYVRSFLPELASLPNEWIHRPWEASPSLLHSCGITLGTTYPYPLISLEEGRKRALMAYHSKY